MAYLPAGRIAKALISTAAKQAAKEVEQQVTREPENPIERIITLGPYSLPSDQVVAEAGRIADDLFGESLEDLDLNEQTEVFEQLHAEGVVDSADTQETARRMPVDYQQWISIGFDVARDKGFARSTTQAQINSGNAPEADLMSVLADIWNDRKSEIRQSVAAAQRVADEEIEVS